MRAVCVQMQWIAALIGMATASCDVEEANGVQKSALAAGNGKEVDVKASTSHDGIAGVDSTGIYSSGGCSEVAKWCPSTGQALSRDPANGCNYPPCP